MARPSTLRHGWRHAGRGRPVWTTNWAPTPFRPIHMEASPSATAPPVRTLDGSNDARAKVDDAMADARFDVLGSTSSMLSVSLNSSQDLFTRKGSLVAVSGNAKNVHSSLSILQPLKRFATGVPFLYQKITSPSPVTALIATKSASDSFIVVPLDGRVDWVVGQRTGLVAWTGQALTLKPRINFGLAISHWGNTFVTGRGLIALSGRGQIYEMTLQTGEEYIVHPSHVLAYSLAGSLPTPYRLSFSSFRLQLPRLGWKPAFAQSISNNPSVVAIRNSAAWQSLSAFIRAASIRFRAFIFGDRLFLKFTGPSTILVQSRGSRIRDVLSDSEINEIAQTRSSTTTRSPSPTKPETSEKE